MIFVCLSCCKENECIFQCYENYELIIGILFGLKKKCQWGIKKERKRVFHFITENAILEESVISL